MDCRIRIFVSMILFLLLSAAAVHAQPKAFSSVWSLSGIGLGYEHNIGPDSFLQIDVKAETAELFRYRKFEPGATVSLSWNMIFGSRESRYGSLLNFYAGPGIILGWADDIKAPSGGLFGIKGRIGIECIYSRNVSISVSASPSLAMHLSVNEDNEFNLRTFRNGLIYGLLPEIGIKYCF